MVFSSLVFISVFLPIVWALHWSIPFLKVRNCILILASLVFYAYGEPIYVLVLLFSSLLNYGGARLMMETGRRKLWLSLLVLVNLGILGIFKYSGFFASSINQVLSLKIPVLQLALPIGISFYTFQAISYVVDCYSGKTEVQKNYFSFLLYLSFFPQLIAGPIVKYRDVEREIQDRSFQVEEISAGFRRFIFGLSKKILIANTVGRVADQIYSAGTDQISTLTGWLAAFSYLLQIYYDFSGYSDMAIGLGQMFGFHFKENFDQPYSSLSITEFWRRWHISLSGWFKEYLYIPLGGNRQGKGKTIRNKMIVFLSTGFWHGANWTFLVWGFYHGCFLLLEELIPALKKMPKLLGRIYSVLVVTVGFVMFRADSIGQAGYFIGQMFTGFSCSAASKSLAMQQLTPWFIAMFVLGMLGAVILPGLMGKCKKKLDTTIWGYGLSVVLLVICMLRLSGDTYNPFIYFRF